MYDPKRETLKEFLERAGPPSPFKPNVFYSKISDSFFVYWDNELAITEQITEEFDLLYGDKSGKPVGIKIHGVKRIIAEQLKHSS